MTTMQALMSTEWKQMFRIKVKLHTNG